MPKYIIKDEDGKKFEVTETDDLEEVTEKDDCAEVHDNESLSSEEISALKRLAAIEDKEEEKIDDEEEEIIETKNTDSKKSIGSIRKQTNDSKITDELIQNDIADLWSKRFESMRKKGE